MKPFDNLIINFLYSGVYHLRVTNSNGVFYSKVIKK
ncbi:MAG: T9SS type A sorting domain-containing protein [Ignavibacteriae bacterium]|nr:T9SS type A sorting domain-containing protein [Ignavibacteriota bacterium]MCB9221944.1 T9SS type A sorting domain-containing protein [Ignavibacteria bacterium]